MAAGQEKCSGQGIVATVGPGPAYLMGSPGTEGLSFPPWQLWLPTTSSSARSLGLGRVREVQEQWHGGCARGCTLLRAEGLAACTWGGLLGWAGHRLGAQVAEFELRVVEGKRDMLVCDWLKPGVFRL